jgi:predicted N-acetyltransferase YhbS
MVAIIPLTIPPMNIRLEQPKDYLEVENLTREAFWNVYRPGCTEHYVLHQYRRNPDFIPELDLVMEEDGRIIGHVMYSRAELMLDDGRSVPSWTFGPISIHPDYKRKGYGLMLLSYSMQKARKMGIGFLCMEGKIDFYRHAGFDLASKLGIHYHSEPRDAEVPYFLAQELIPGWIRSNGITEANYCPPKGYFVADEHPEAFEAYEATFPQKDKDFAKGQLPQFCQSCLMPLTCKDDCGTNADGSTNFDYCQYCYKDGQFLQDCTMDEMIAHCAQFIDEINKQMPEPMTREQYILMANGFFPTLKRWKSHESPER